MIDDPSSADKEKRSFAEEDWNKTSTLESGAYRLSQQSRSCHSSILSEDHDFRRVMASTRDISRLGGGPMAQSYVDPRRSRKQNLEGVLRTRGMNIENSAESWQSRVKIQGSETAQWLKLSSTTSGGSGSKTSNTNTKQLGICNVGFGDCLVHNFEPNTDYGFVKFQTQHQVNFCASASKSDSDDIGYEAWLDLRDQLFQTNPSDSTQSWSPVPDQCWQNSCWEPS